MQMTNGEICRSYKEAADKKQQITVLADLNVCGKRDIVDILRAGGCLVPPMRGVPKMPKPEETDRETVEAEVLTADEPNPARTPGDIPTVPKFDREETDTMIFALHKIITDCERDIAKYAELIESTGNRLDRCAALIKKLGGQCTRDD